MKKTSLFRLTLATALTARAENLTLSAVIQESLQNSPEVQKAQSAAREAEEEAGVTGEMTALPLGHYRYIKDKAGAALPIRVEVFALRVTGQHQTWPEQGTRKSLWLPPDRAAARVAETGLKDILTNFRASRVNVA